MIWILFGGNTAIVFILFEGNTTIHTAHDTLREAYDISIESMLEGNAGWISYFSEIRIVLKQCTDSSTAYVI